MKRLILMTAIVVFGVMGAARAMADGSMSSGGGAAGSSSGGGVGYSGGWTGAPAEKRSTGIGAPAVVVNKPDAEPPTTTGILAKIPSRPATAVASRGLASVSAGATRTR
jgi:hypothetical protein